MLIKLLKHELRATSRIMLPVFAAVLGISVLAHFSIQSMESNQSGIVTIISGVIIVLFAVGIMSLPIVAVVLSINRFRASVLGDEGYLTMTLPVSVHSVLWSKILVSSLWLILSGAVVFASCYILAFDSSVVHFTFEFFGESFDLMKNYPGTTVTLIELIATIFLSLCAGTLSFYAALAVGHGFPRHKMAYSVVVFFAVNSILSVISGIGMEFLDEVDFTRFFSSRGPIYIANIFLLFFMLYFVVTGAIYYIIAVYNLKHRLNLE